MNRKNTRHHCLFFGATPAKLRGKAALSKSYVSFKILMSQETLAAVHPISRAKGTSVFFFDAISKVN
jgi:hypothetical protein